MAEASDLVTYAATSKGPTGDQASYASTDQAAVVAWVADQRAKGYEIMTAGAHAMGTTGVDVLVRSWRA